MMTSRYLFRPMNEEDAREIAAWRYEAPYDFYDMTNDPEGLEKLLGPPERRRGYYAVLSGGELVGFFCYSLGGQLPGFDYPGDGCIDIGLGLRPDLTGKGLGLKFIRAGLQFGRRRFSLPPSGSPSLPSTSARSGSTSAGFRRARVFGRSTNGGEHPFLLMTREA
jgi:[ribosomal protein S18]-alanine N-acetyltransferase